MKGINQITMTAALTKNADLKYTASGVAILTINLGGIEKIGNGDIPFYQRATVLGKYAEALMNDLTAGVCVLVTGRLNWRSWDDPQGGGKRSAVDIGVDRVITLEPGELSYDSRQQPRLVGAVNEVLLAGNLTRDAETKSIQNSAVTRIGLAVNDPYYTNGETRERVGFFNIEAWDNVDLGMDPSGLVKSAPVVVRGRLKNSSWTDKDGNKRYSQEVEENSVMVAATGTATGTPAAAPKREAVAAGGGRSAPSRQRLDIDSEFPLEEDLPF